LQDLLEQVKISWKYSTLNGISIGYEIFDSFTNNKAIAQIPIAPVSTIYVYVDAVTTYNTVISEEHII